MLKYKKRVFLKENILSLDILLNYIVRFYRNLLLGTLYAKECYVRSFFFFFQGCRYFWLRFYKHKQKLDIQKISLACVPIQCSKIREQNNIFTTDSVLKTTQFENKVLKCM